MEWRGRRGEGDGGRRERTREGEERERGMRREDRGRGESRRFREREENLAPTVISKSRRLYI